MLFAWVGLLVVLEVLAEMALERWGKTPRPLFLGMGVLLYVALAIAFAMAIRRSKQLVLLNTIWQSANVAAVAVIGIVFLKEKVTARRLTAIVLATVACLMMIE